MYKKYSWIATLSLFLFASIATLSNASPWGANYFPNVSLTTHEGKKVNFFDDVIKDKIVAINFIYTHCPDTCSLETAQLVRVQKIMGERLGKDVFFYSISIDPERDTPKVLREYRERFGAKWTFLTGKKEDIIQLRKKLGLYISEIQDGSNNHNVTMIIGNQKTGQWMKRSPFENTHLLADQLGNWLSGWKHKQARTADYADAPELRTIARGEQIFRTRCATCHTITGKELADALGPDLLNVSKRREQRWLYDWLKAPDQMINKKDPIAMKMYERYNKLAMPNMRLNKEEADVLLGYIDDESRRVLGVPVSIEEKTVKTTLSVNKKDPTGDVVAIMNAWVREAYEKATVNAGYMTLINASDREETLLRVECEDYKTIEVHEMTHVNGLMEMHEVEDLTIPAGGQMKLEPGGKHLMLMNPKRHLTKGQQVNMTLIFKSGKKQTVSIQVAAK